jgi:hypothetical protein
MNLTKDQRKFMWIAIALFGFWYFVRPMIFYAMQASFYRQQAAVRQQQAKAAAATPATLGIPPNRLLGIWEGKTLIDNRGLCSLRFELRQGQEGRFAGFSTLTCLIGRGPGSSDPETAILSGTAEKGSFQFRVDKVVGPDGNGCAPSAFTLTPFGATQLAAEWKEPTCSGGHVLLTRTRP